MFVLKTGPDQFQHIGPMYSIYKKLPWLIGMLKASREIEREIFQFHQLLFNLTSFLFLFTIVSNKIF